MERPVGAPTKPEGDHVTSRSIAPLVWQSCEVCLETPLRLRDGYGFDLFRTIVQEIVPVPPRCVDTVNHVGWNSAYQSHAIEKNFSPRMSARPRGSPERADAGFEFGEHPNEISTLEIFVGRSKVSRTWPFAESTCVTSDVR